MSAISNHDGRPRRAAPRGATPEMWAAYNADPTAENRNVIIEAEYHLIDVALRRSGGPVFVKRDASQRASWAVDGLLDAIRRYNPDTGDFAPFAVRRMIGAIGDGIRQEAWAETWSKKGIRVFNNKREELEQRLRRSVTDTEVMDALGINTMPVSRFRLTADGMPELDDERHPRTDLGDGGVHRAFRLVSLWIARLTPVEAQVMSLYYLDGLTVQDIAFQLGVSKTFVSELRQRSFARFDPGWSPKEPRATVGSELRRLRRARGFSQEDVARRLPVVHVSSLREWEANRVLPPVRPLVALADFYKVTVGELLRPLTSAAES